MTSFFDIRARLLPPTKGIKQTEKGLTGIEQKAQNLRRTLGQAFALAGLGAGAVGTVRFLAEFSQSVSTVEAVANATGSEIAALNEEFKALGTSTRFSSTQAAEGALFLARAGFDASQVLESLDDTLRLAQAGALDLGQAADIASNVLTGFRLDVDQASRTVDVLALAANSANTDVSQLGTALKFVAPIAAGVGVELEEATAAIQELSNAGLQGSLAGTGLRRVLSELESPSVKTVDLFKQLSISADEVRVSEVGLTQALERLRDAGVDTGQALELFGDRGGPAFEVLRNAIPAVKANTLALQEAEGTAERIAEVMDDNLNGALLSVKSAFQGLTLEIADTSGGAGALRIVLEGVAGTLRFLASNAELAAIGFTAVGTAITVAVLPAMKRLIASTKLLNLALLKNPFVLLATTSVAVGVAIAGARKELEIFDETLKDIVRNGQSLSALSEFGNLNEDIIVLEMQLEEAKRRLEELGTVDSVEQIEVFDDIASELETISALEASLEELRKKRQQLIDQSPKAQAAREKERMQRQAIKTGIDEQLSSLQSELDLLGKVAREREIGADLQDRINEITEEGGTLAEGDRAVLENQLRINQAARERAAILDTLNAPQAEFNTGLTRSLELFEMNKITAEELKDILTELQASTNIDVPDLPQLGGVGQVGTPDRGERGAELQELNAALNEQQRLLMLTADARNVEIEALRVEQELREKGIELSDRESAKLRERLTGLQTLANQQAQSAEETGIFRDALESSRNTLVDFALGGESSFDDFTESFLENLKQIAAQKALSALIGGLFGAPGEGGGAGLLGFIPGFGGGRQEGGPVNPNETFLVGEEGPELFRPPTSGDIVPAGETAAQMAAGQQAPVVNVTTAPPNVTINNVSDPGEIAASVDSGELDDSILNVMQRNPKRARGLGT